MTRPIECWDSEGEERLTHTDRDEAIEYILDDAGILPETIEICGYARMVPNGELLAHHALERLLEDLDEEYGDPEGGSVSSTRGMKEAAKVFITAVLDDYVSWACELVKRETVDVTAWVKENRPDWLEQDSRR